MKTSVLVVMGALAGLAVASGHVFAHGSVTPQAFATPGLPDLGTKWLDRDPFVGNKTAIEIGAEGFKENCAACHGLDMNSGGMAPDLHGLPTGADGDEIFKDRVMNGKLLDGMIKMPVYSGIVSQTGLWAIRAYIESNHTE